jgi:hypothetical protein
MKHRGVWGRAGFAFSLIKGGSLIRPPGHDERPHPQLGGFTAMLLAQHSCRRTRMSLRGFDHWLWLGRSSLRWRRSSDGGQVSDIDIIRDCADLRDSLLLKKVCSGADPLKRKTVEALVELVSEIARFRRVMREITPYGIANALTAQNILTASTGPRGREPMWESPLNELAELATQEHIAAFQFPSFQDQHHGT